MKRIYLAGGCFWGLQKYFDQFDGIMETEVGYANGPDKAPTYREVCNDSGHAETLRIDYDERKNRDMTAAYSTEPESSSPILHSLRILKRYTKGKSSKRALPLPLLLKN